MYNDETNDSPSAIAASQSKSWPQRILKWLGMGVLTLGALGLSGFLLGIVALAVAYPNLPDISGLTDYRPKLPMRVFSADGVLIGEFGEERRKFTPIQEIPDVMKNAVLAIEDARFYQHSGVDYIGVIRAGMANFSDSKSQGASTITMQVARNFYLPTEKTFTRKIYEILLALKIERQLSKAQILEIYMNQIYLGQRAYGFTSAAETYFGKHISELNIAEAAMLAGLPKAPSAYNPIVKPARAKLRQQYIIDRMLENGFITQAQHDEAIKTELTYKAKVELPLHAEFVAEAARSLMFAQYGEEAYTRGLNVYTSINSIEQEAAYKALRKGLIDFDKRHGYRGPEAYIELTGSQDQDEGVINEAFQDHPDNDEYKTAIVKEASPKKVVAFRENGDLIEVTGNGLRFAAPLLQAKANPKKSIKAGAVIRIMQSGSDQSWSIVQVPEVEGALVSMEPTSGFIRSMVGGFDFSKNKFNHVLQAWRQPGSSFKPFIYSGSLEKGLTPATIINDSPLFFDSSTTGSQPWEPKNYDGTFDGPMTMRKALAKSKNMVSIRILEKITPTYAQDWISRFGFDKAKHPAYLTMALGAGSVTPMQMAQAYSVFANGGYFVTPVLVTRIEDTKGRLLSKVERSMPPESARVIDARNAFVTSSLLQEVTRAGTARAATVKLKRNDLYGKTGTTNDAMDAWFAGYQPSLTGVVWIGYDTPKKLGDRETGGGLSLPVWIDYMQVALKNTPVQEYKPPAGVVNHGGDWIYEEYANGAGVGYLGLEGGEGVHTPNAPTAEERQGILDLFNQE